MIKPLILVLSIAGLIIISYSSRPDNGGLKACATIFQMKEIEQMDLKISRIVPWKPFESSKYVFSYVSGTEVNLKKLLRKYGYKEWKSGGVKYGSIDRGWGVHDNVEYTSIKRNGRSYTWAIDHNKNEAIGVEF